MSHPIHSFWVLLFVVVMLESWAAHSCLADLLDYDGFDYAPVGSALEGKDGGFGFQPGGGWHVRGYNASTADNFLIGEGSQGTPNLPTEGNHVVSAAVFDTISGVGRVLADPVTAAETATRYVSFTLTPEGTLGEGIWNGFFGVTLDAEAPTSPDLFIGKAGGGTMDRYVIEHRGGDNQVATSEDVVVGETEFFVVKSEFVSGGSDSFTLYVNPDPLGPEPMTGSFLSLDLADFTAVTFYSTGAFRVDELRVGETFADVTSGVPEPGILASLVGMAVTAALLRWLRKRAG
jgi:hypothetical protein